MKLLKGLTETIKHDNIEVVVRIPDTVTQSTIAAMSVEVVDGVPRPTGLNGRMKLLGYMMRNCIESVTIDGVEYDPEVLATRADISDKATRQTLLTIVGMVEGHAFPTEEEQKK